MDGKLQQIFVHIPHVVSQPMTVLVGEFAPPTVARETLAGFTSAHPLAWT